MTIINKFLALLTILTVTSATLNAYSYKIINNTWQQITVELRIEKVFGYEWLTPVSLNSGQTTEISTGSAYCLGRVKVNGKELYYGLTCFNLTITVSKSGDSFAVNVK
jgi:hypothetical protein